MSPHCPCCAEHWRVLELVDESVQLLARVVLAREGAELHDLRELASTVADLRGRVARGERERERGPAPRAAPGRRRAPIPPAPPAEGRKGEAGPEEGGGGDDG